MSGPDRLIFEEMAEGNALGGVSEMTPSAFAVFWRHQQDVGDGNHLQLATTCSTNYNLALPAAGRQSSV